MPPVEAHCVVLDEHAGPLLALTPTVKVASRPVEIPAADFHREQTVHLGAQHGEHRRIETGDLFRQSLAWSAHLGYLVQQSAERDAAQAPSVGWDPYGDNNE